MSKTKKPATLRRDPVRKPASQSDFILSSDYSKKKVYTQLQLEEAVGKAVNDAKQVPNTLELIVSTKACKARLLEEQSAVKGHLYDLEDKIKHHDTVLGELSEKLLAEVRS